MYYVYAIYNKKHKKIYIGQTSNVEEHLSLHNNKTFKGSYTSKFDGYWILIYSEECASRTACIAREKQLKSFRGREFIKQKIR